MDDIEQTKSEEATPYKLSQARKKGMTARGLDLGVVGVLIALAGYLWIFGDALGSRIAHMSQRALAAAPQVGGSKEALVGWATQLVGDSAQALAPLLGAVVLAALLVGFAQSGFVFAPAALKADFGKLNPAHGLKRVFSVHTVIETVKAILKFLVYSVITTYVVLEAAAAVVHAGSDASGLIHELRQTGLQLLGWFVLSGVVFAAADQLIVRRQFAKKMRMSRRELRDEVRNREGDPRIRQRRRQLAAELRQRSQSLRGVRGSDLMVTNPTHYAVALQYDMETMNAPKIVSRGAGDFALRLKRMAFVYNVPIFEDRALARELFHGGLLDAEIPAGTFTSVAELYRRQRGASPSARATS